MAPGGFKVDKWFSSNQLNMECLTDCVRFVILYLLLTLETDTDMIFLFYIS